MPHIRIRGTQEKTASLLSREVQELANLIGTEADNFTFELVQTNFFANGQTSTGSPFVEVLWFARSQEMKQVVANHITDTIRSSEAHDYITVVFIDLESTSYFENSSHFGK